MIEKFNLSAELAKSFGLDLEEAYNTMLAFSLENKFDCYSIEEQNQLNRVLETLTNFSDMWERGQIILISKEREKTE